MLTLQTYLDCIEQLHKLKPENLDFKNNLEGARMQINSWIEQETKGKRFLLFLHLLLLLGIIYIQ